MLIQLTFFHILFTHEQLKPLNSEIQSKESKKERHKTCIIS